MMERLEDIASEVERRSKKQGGGKTITLKNQQSSDFALQTRSRTFAALHCSRRIDP